MQHPFGPIYNEKSSILILGTFPSIKSREYGFYYSNVYNRFWKLMTYITNSNKLPESVAEKKQLLLDNKIALWDTIQSCDIKGSSDASITNIVPAKLNIIFNVANIQNIYANGSKAFQVYMKYCYPIVNRNIIKLPSTSPANAKYSVNQLLCEWNKYINLGQI